MKKAYLRSSCSTVVTKKFKRVSVEEFLFSEITVLEPATLPNELFHSHFPKFLITIVEWYIDDESPLAPFYFVIGRNLV